MSKITFVSGCDANYYPLLREWIHSVRRHPESKSIDINMHINGIYMNIVYVELIDTIWLFSLLW